MRSAESAGSVSIFDGPLGAVTTVTASAVDESTRDRATAARRTRMGTPSGKIRWQEADSGTPRDGAGSSHDWPRHPAGLVALPNHEESVPADPGSLSRGARPLRLQRPSRETRYVRGRRPEESGRHDRRYRPGARPRPQTAPA